MGPTTASPTSTDERVSAGAAVERCRAAGKAAAAHRTGECTDQFAAACVGCLAACNVARPAPILTCRRVDVDGCQHGSSGSSSGGGGGGGGGEQQRQRSSGTVCGLMGRIVCVWVSLWAACDWTVLACVVRPAAARHHICACGAANAYVHDSFKCCCYSMVVCRML